MLVEKKDIKNKITGKGPWNLIVIDYEKENGIGIYRDIEILEKESPYKFYIFNEEMMIYGVEVEEEKYYLEVIKAEEFINKTSSQMYVDSNEIFKVKGNFKGRILKFNRGITKSGIEKIQFTGLEV